jgi:hypothetical protein
MAKLAAHGLDREEAVMSFMLVITSLPNRDDHREIEAWSSFRGYAETDSLKGAKGVFCINESAWLFDTRKALNLLGSVIHHAHRFGIQLHTFQLHGETVRSHVASYPQSAALEVFLGSYQNPGIGRRDGGN